MAGTKNKRPAKAAKRDKEQDESVKAAADLPTNEDGVAIEKDEILERLYRIADISSERWLAILKSDSWKGVAIAADSFQRALFSAGQIENRLQGGGGLLEGDIHLNFTAAGKAKQPEKSDKE